MKPLLSPEIYHETLDAIHANAQTLRDERISIRFEPREVVYEKSTGKVFVYGRSYTRIGNSLEDEYENERTYEFKFTIEQYAPILHYINTYEGRPMTKNAIEKAEKDRHREEMRERKKAEKQGIRYRPKAEDEVKNQWLGLWALKQHTQRRFRLFRFQPLPRPIMLPRFKAVNAPMRRKMKRLHRLRRSPQ